MFSLVNLAKSGFLDFQGIIQGSCFFRPLPERRNGERNQGEKELKVVFARMCLLTLINGSFCDCSFIHMEDSKKQINNKAMVTMPKKQ